MKRITACLVLLGAMSGLVPVSAQQVADAKPVAPRDLAAEVTGHRVILSWTNGGQGEVLVTNNFEKAGAQPDDEVSLLVDGWTVKTTNTSSPSCTWFNYPNAEWTGASDWAKLIYEGDRSAVVAMDLIEDGEHDMHQDEWLISPVVKKGAYLKFSYYIDPRVILSGADPDFPDHYAVFVSTDGGKTWGNAIWDARYDGKPEDAWQTVTLGLPAADSVRIAFRAYGDIQTDEYGDTINQSLYGVWAVDAVSIMAGQEKEKEFKADFETGADEMDMTFEADGWTVKQTVKDPEDPELDLTLSTWFKNPAVDDVDANPFLDYVINGSRSAMLMSDAGNLPQDEWLISPVCPGARQLQFSYKAMADFYGEAHPESPEDIDCSGYFEVYLSTDGGKTWSEKPVWKAVDDEERQIEESGMIFNTVQVGLSEKPTDGMCVAFRGRGGENGLATGIFVDDVTLRVTDIVDHYEIHLDGKVLVDNVRSTVYVDDSRKTAGEHTYSVYAVTADKRSSDAATVKVDLQEIIFAAPKNFNCVTEYDDKTGTYTAYLYWEAPDVAYLPSSYRVYSDNILAGMDLTAEDGKKGIGRSGLSKGIYEYSIEAIYTTPDSVSERVYRQVAVDVRLGVMNLKAEQEGQDVLLTWDEPQADGHDMGTYTVYRNGEKLAEGLKDKTYRDAAVADGLYSYTVVAVYADGEESVRVSVSHQAGKEVLVALPYEQKFNNTFLPVNWAIKNQSTLSPDKYTWYFDDGSNLGIKGKGFEGNYAAIDCYKSGFYRVNMALELPVIDLKSTTRKADVTLSFNFSYAYKVLSQVGVEWYFPEDDEWYILGSIDTTEGYRKGTLEEGDFNIQTKSMRIGDVILPTDLDKMESLRLRFHYEGVMAEYFAFDNVLVTAPDVANEKTMEEDASVRVAASNGQLQLKAAYAIKQVEVFARNGAKMLDVRGNDGYEMNLPVDGRGPVLVRVTTSQGVKVVKILL